MPGIHTIAEAILGFPQFPATYASYVLSQHRVPWKTIPVSAGDGSCMVTWKDSFIVFGGTKNPSGVQIYNHTAGSYKKKHTPSHTL